MKIRKINDNQLRCILSKNDLEMRNIKMDELAYGSSKVRELFSDMMQQAYVDFGFVANNVPLVIEAIPVAKGDIILNISKVDDPDELDFRFSRFSPFKAPKEDFDINSNLSSFTTKSVLNKLNLLDDNSQKKVTDFPSSFYYTAYFSFENLEPVISVANLINDRFSGQSSLIKLNNKYVLLLQKKDMDKVLFNDICNIVSDFGKQEMLSFHERLYYSNSAKTLLKTDAIMQLSLINGDSDGNVSDDNYKNGKNNKNKRRER